MSDALVVCRLLHFAAAMLLFGASFFRWTLAPAQLGNALDRRLTRGMRVAAAIVIASTLAWLSLVAGDIGNGWADAVNPDTVVATLVDTEFGQVWAWRLGLALIIVASLAFGRYALWTIFPLSALFLASLGLVGHATMHAGTVGWLQRANHALHLLAAGAWLGGLVPLYQCLEPSTTRRCNAKSWSLFAAFRLGDTWPLLSYSSAAQ